jgi:hypothetical protein
MAEDLFFLSTSHLFGSYTSASFWEQLRRAIQNLIPNYSQRNDLIIKHKQFLDILDWAEIPADFDLVKAFQCKVNNGILDDNGVIKPLTANIYVDDILGAAAFKQWVLGLLAAICEAIFLVCGEINLESCQCPLLLKKWKELVIGPRQVILGLIVDTNKMTVGITDKYIQQVKDLLNEKWNNNCKMFNVLDMQKLVGKSARRLGDGAP